MEIAHITHITHMYTQNRSLSEELKIVQGIQSSGLAGGVRGVSLT